MCEAVASRRVKEQRHRARQTDDADDSGTARSQGSSGAAPAATEDSEAPKAEVVDAEATVLAVGAGGETGRLMRVSS